MRKFLLCIGVIQEHTNTVNNKKGRGFFKARRINPYNPLSYIVVIVFFLIGIIAFGVIGIWKDMDGNPFKWS